MRFVFHDDSLPAVPRISVDGVVPGGPNFSHWPGHRTPQAVLHDLSTGIALRVAALPAAERQALTQGLDEVTNNHVDTDGILSVFTFLEPARALAAADRLLDAARTGDLQVFTTRHALALDLALTALCDRVAAEARPGERDPALRQRQFEAALEALPELLLDPEAALGTTGPARGEFEQVLADLDRVARGGASLEVDAAAGLAVVTAGSPLHRVALNTQAGAATRVLAVVPWQSGHLYRFHDRVENWFHGVTLPVRERLPLAPIARRLDDLEASQSDPSWQAHDVDEPVPELWFGVTGHGRSFGPTVPGELCVSRLPPRLVIEALRGHFVEGATANWRPRR